MHLQPFLIDETDEVKVVFEVCGIKLTFVLVAWLVGAL